ncbi:MAG: RdgB/HAM1 family non-canonical purine NTP pyrophosphatase [Oscillospiraceae bacterium]|nr:RdgB/HAM1 family non-canonical purine NTP pyrophosphatase [Oscillospiraceae bacterium]
MMKLIIASNNAHKLVEIKAILGDFFEEIQSLREAGIDHDTVEDGTTFMENAIKKAREIAEISGCCALADDSGICVDALGGAPGIYSARFSGVHGDDKANNRLLLQKLEGAESRKAHYTCAIALVRPDGSTVTAEGYLHGEIGFEEVGENGFGYDPLFILPELGCTTAQISSEQKNAISHRAVALKELVEKLK